MKKIKTGAVFFISIFLQTFAQAASVDTISVYSNAMQKSSRCVVILPESYKNNQKGFPVVYLLHGYSGNYSNWINKVPAIKNYVDEFQMIVVCPDGNYDSWYVNSPIDKNRRYETYISAEVPHFIDSAYHTIKQRNFRAITGLSMGGHGALFIAWRQADFFGAGGSMSGVLNLSPWKGGYDMIKVFGDTLNNNNAAAFSVVNIIKEIPAQIPAIIFDCGINDPFLVTNRMLHSELLELKIPHDYIERNGAHNWDYWSNAIGYQLMFFHKYFSKQY